MNKLNDKNIYLIGYRACGKTTIGGLLAEQMQVKFADTDVMVVEDRGCEIAELVKNEGWDSFRESETAMLKKISKHKNAVVSCGGGIVLSTENRQILSESFTVYLEADASVLADRLTSKPLHGQRPSLTGKSIVDEVREVLNERRELYEKSALHKIDATSSPEEILNEIIDKFKIYSAGEPV